MNSVVPIQGNHVHVKAGVSLLFIKSFSTLTVLQFSISAHVKLKSSLVHWAGLYASFKILEAESGSVSLVLEVLIWNHLIKF